MDQQDLQARTHCATVEWIQSYSVVGIVTGEVVIFWDWIVRS